MNTERPKVNAKEALNKCSFQPYKKYAVKLNVRSKQLFIAVELILFLHGKEQVLARFKQFIKKYPDLEGKGKPPVKNTSSAMAMKNFVNRKRR